MFFEDVNKYKATYQYPGPCLTGDEMPKPPLKILLNQQSIKHCIDHFLCDSNIPYLHVFHVYHVSHLFLFLVYLSFFRPHEQCFQFLNYKNLKSYLYDYLHFFQALDYNYLANQNSCFYNFTLVFNYSFPNFPISFLDMIACLKFAFLFFRSFLHIP